MRDEGRYDGLVRHFTATSGLRLAEPDLDRDQCASATGLSVSVEKLDSLVISLKVETCVRSLSPSAISPSIVNYNFEFVDREKYPLLINATDLLYLHLCLDLEIISKLCCSD